MEHRRPLPLFFLSAFPVVIAIASGVVLVVRYDLPTSVVAMHGALVASLQLLIISIGTAIVSTVHNRSAQRLSLWVLALGFVAALLVAESAIHIALASFRDYPTLQLARGYLGDAVALASALPLSPAILWLSVVGLLCAILLFATLFYLALNVVCRAWARATSAGRPALILRSLLYLNALLLGLTIYFPPMLLLESREPLLSSVHNIRFATNHQYNQQNPIEAALDRELRSELAKKQAVRRPNVIFVYVDALRSDVTQPYGAYRENMPFVTRMVASGDWIQFEDVLASCSGTICGLAALLQSRQTRHQGPGLLSLPKVLADQGYRNAYVLASNHQDYFNLKRYYEPYHFYKDGKDLAAKRSADDLLILSGLDMLGQFDGQPTFLMIGMISPHVASVKHDEYRRFLPDKLPIAGDASYGMAYRNNYENGVLQADGILEQIFTKLDALGFLRDSIIVVTADHGESLGEAGLYGHVKSLNGAELRIPLWMRNPYMRLSPSMPALQVDVAPTILASLGLPLPPSWQGLALTGLDATRCAEHYLQDLPRLVAITCRRPGEGYKYLLDAKSNVERVFDIVNDPEERFDVLKDLPQDQLAEFRRSARVALLGLRH